MLVSDWNPETMTPQNTNLTLARVIDHIDHICQLTGNTRHVAIGSDLDGAFGTEQGPTDVDTISDLQKIPALLAARGYSPDDIDNIRSGNVLRFLRTAWTYDF